MCYYARKLEKTERRNSKLKFEAFWFKFHRSREAMCVKRIIELGV